MLTIFRRHLAKCRHRSRKERRCACPIQVEGRSEVAPFARLSTSRSWEAAVQIVRDIELGITHKAPMTVVDAGRLFLEDIEARKLSRESAKKYSALRCASRIRTGRNSCSRSATGSTP